MSLSRRERLQEPDAHYLENFVRFSFSFCDLKDYCITKLSKSELENFYKRMGHFEKMTWKQVIALSREKGMSIEKKTDAVHLLLSSMISVSDTFAHFRVNGVRTPFRVFVARSKDLAYILKIDSKGSMHH